MDTTPYWLASADIPAFPTLDRDLTVDVVVIGGGITGITTAYLLDRLGVKVALLERETFAGIDTGHTTAHLTYVTDERLTDLAKHFGRDHAQAAWDAGAAALRQTTEICAQEEIDATWEWVPGYLHLPLEGHGSGGLEEEAKLARELGFEAAFVERVPLYQQPGVRFSDQALFHPRRYLAGLLAKLAQGGASVFQQSAVEEVQEKPLAVKANGHTISCGYVVVATHNPLMGLRGFVESSLFQTKLSLYTSYAVGAKLPRGLVAPSSYWDTAEPYSYLRIHREASYDYAIMGGADHKTGQAAEPAAHFGQVAAQLRRILPQAEIDHHWSGQVIETSDGLPYMGEAAEKQFVATGFSGNGMTFGTLGAMMAADAITGRKNPWRDLFALDRKPIHGGVWDYLTENKDYPYYLVKGLLERPEAESLAAVAPGEGKIVKTKEGKVAAYRDASGLLTVRSAVCPHLGCIVKWNAAETTWDCPCHGSRFHATGEVFAGPAESSLAETKST